MVQFDMYHYIRIDLSLNHSPRNQDEKHTKTFDSFRRFYIVILFKMSRVKMYIIGASFFPHKYTYALSEMFILFV
jgi:hypothetical protein